MLVVSCIWLELTSDEYRIKRAPIFLDLGYERGRLVVSFIWLELTSKGVMR